MSLICIPLASFVNCFHTPYPIWFCLQRWKVGNYLFIPSLAKYLLRWLRKAPALPWCHLYSRPARHYVPLFTAGLGSRQVKRLMSLPSQVPEWELEPRSKRISPGLPRCSGPSLWGCRESTSHRGCVSEVEYLEFSKRPPHRNGSKWCLCYKAIQQKPS